MTHEISLNLTHEIHCHDHNDQQRCTAEELGEVLADAEAARECGQDGNDAEEQRPGQGDAAHD